MEIPPRPVAPDGPGKRAAGERSEAQAPRGAQPESHLEFRSRDEGIEQSQHRSPVEPGVVEVRGCKAASAAAREQQLRRMLAGLSPAADRAQDTSAFLDAVLALSGKSLLNPAAEGAIRLAATGLRLQPDRLAFAEHVVDQLDAQWRERARTPKDQKALASALVARLIGEVLPLFAGCTAPIQGRDAQALVQLAELLLRPRPAAAADVRALQEVMVRLAHEPAPAEAMAMLRDSLHAHPGAQPKSNQQGAARLAPSSHAGDSWPQAPAPQASSTLACR